MIALQKFMYTLLLLGSGAGVGLASILSVMDYKLSQVSKHARRYLAHGITKVGIALTQGVLTWRLAEVGTAEVTVYSWLYVAGLIIVTTGMALQVKDTIVELAIKETYKNTGRSAEDNEGTP